MTYTLNEVQLAIIRVKSFTSSGGLERFPLGPVVLVHIQLLSTGERGHLIVWLTLVLHFSTQSHLERGEKIKCLNHSAQVREKVKLAYFWVLRCCSDATIFNSWPLSGLSPRAGRWVTESDLPAWEFGEKFPGKSLRNVFGYSPLDVRWFYIRFALQSNWPQSLPSSSFWV